SHPACSGKRTVLGRVELLTVERNSEPVALGPQSQRVPLAGRNLDVGALELLPPPFDHAVEADIVFEGVGPNHIIVIRRGKSYDNPARPVDLSCDWLESYFDVDILG